MRLVLMVAAAACGWAAMASAAPKDFERDVLDELNRARAHPREVAAELRRYRDRFEGRVVRDEGDPVGVATVEGRRAVDEAIAFLTAQPPLPPLENGAVLARAAQGWAASQGAAGARGHGTGAGARVRAAGGDIYVGETISYGMASPRAVARQLIVDDGQPGRGHRALIFTPAFRFAGVGCGWHARTGSMCVVDYAATPDGAPVRAQVAAVQLSRASALSR